MASNILNNAAINLRRFSTATNRLLSALRTTAAAAGPPHRHYYSTKPNDNNKQSKASFRAPNPFTRELIEFHGDWNKGWWVSDGNSMCVLVRMPGYAPGDVKICSKDHTMFVVGRDHEQPNLWFGAEVKLPTCYTYEFSKLENLVHNGLVFITVPKRRM